VRHANAACAIATIVVVAGFVGVVPIASAQTLPCKGPWVLGGPRDRVPDSDVGFISRLDTTDVLELDMARYIVDRAQDPAVRAFAQRSIEDHSLATVKLAAATRGTGFHPGTMGVSSPDFDMLKVGRGMERDNDYMCLEVRVRRRMLRDLSWESDHGQMTAVKALATSLVATLEQQLQVALAYLAAHNLTPVAPPSGRVPR
jgi:predicted outer membrane protein